ncbi:hypothetical protein DAEQUDRAFT_768599 [Daedalea quercina L-15889]|uniref:Uncharacterized protein n=1 Tax=Daedalea quercina L-15889 TaxID=1314783 RepID=A0A165MJE9_9APHY|nr:hypothetical protein DAEQUDRAFT_768599 [Daedalea quercina L-15889]
MAIRNVPLSWKDPVGWKQVWDISSLWHELQKNTLTDKATSAFFEVCIPFGNAPRTTIDERSGTGQILCAVCNFNSGTTSHHLEKSNILLYGKECKKLRVQFKKEVEAARAAKE